MDEVYRYMKQIACKEHPGVGDAPRSNRQPFQSASVLREETEEEKLAKVGLFCHG